MGAARAARRRLPRRGARRPRRPRPADAGGGGVSRRHCRSGGRRGHRSRGAGLVSRGARDSDDRRPRRRLRPGRRRPGDRPLPRDLRARPQPRSRPQLDSRRHQGDRRQLRALVSAHRPLTRRKFVATTDLERFVDADGRAERIKEVRKRIDAEDISYVYYQFPSVTGRIMGKGVPAPHWETIANKGFQLVYGATANLFTDRHGDYIGYGPEESELAAIADLSTFAQLPWDPRVARVFCDCYDTETGELLDADPRQNLKRVVAEFEEELGYSFLIGIEPEMMWLKKGQEGSEPEGVTKPYCYHIHQFEELRPVLLDVVEYGQALGLDMSYGDHEDAPGQDRKS